jgi:26S proteasome regulatory subunit N9
MAAMAVDSSSQSKPAKLNLEEFITSALSGTPSELHPFFDRFQVLYTKKWVLSSCKV